MRFFVVVAVAELLACASDDRSDQGRGTAACRIWQDAVCDHAFDKCHNFGDPNGNPAPTRAQCDQQYQSFTCKSDKQAMQCAEVFDSAACNGNPEKDCNFDSVANPVPAENACKNFVQAFCQRYVECGNEPSVQVCVNSADSTGKLVFDCSHAIGYRLEFESCLKAVASEACDNLDPSAPPAQCDNVIIRTR
jgi:hypothetical protein